MIIYSSQTTQILIIHTSCSQIINISIIRAPAALTSSPQSISVKSWGSGRSPSWACLWALAPRQCAPARAHAQFRLNTFRTSRNLRRLGSDSEAQWWGPFRTHRMHVGGGRPWWLFCRWSLICSVFKTDCLIMISYWMSVSSISSMFPSEDCQGPPHWGSLLVVCCSQCRYLWLWEERPFLECLGLH